MAKVEEAFLVAELYYGRNFQRPVKFVWETDRTRAGYCHFARKEFGFNPILAAENEDDFINQIIPHEVAHWIDKEVHGYQYTVSRRTGRSRRISHGRTWKSIMVNVYGLDPDRCHTYDVASVKTRTRIVVKAFKYSCPCGIIFNLTAVRHNKIQKGATFHCMKCKGNLRLVSVKSPDEIRMETLQRKIDFLTRQQNTKKL